MALLVSRHCQDITGAALGEVWLRLVDLGLHNDSALPAIHTALDGTGDIHLQLPLLTAERGKEKNVSNQMVLVPYTWVADVNACVAKCC